MLLPKMTSLPAVMALTPTVMTFLSVIIFELRVMTAPLPVRMFPLMMMIFLHIIPTAVKTYVIYIPTYFAGAMLCFTQ